MKLRWILNLTAILSREVLQVSKRLCSKFESSWDLRQFYRGFNANKFQSHYKFQSSVIFSVLFDWRRLHKLLEKLNLHVKTKWSRRWKNGSVFSFNLNSESCIVILQNVSIMVPEFSTFYEKLAGIFEGACKTWRQLRLGQ